MPIKKLFNMKFWGSLYTQKVTFGSFHDSVMTRIDWALLFAGHIRPFLCNSLCTCVCLSFHTAHITCPTCVWILMCTAADCFLKFKLPHDGYRSVINVPLCLAGTCLDYRGYRGASQSTFQPLDWRKNQSVLSCNIYFLLLRQRQIVGCHKLWATIFYFLPPPFIWYWLNRQ